MSKRNIQTVTVLGAGTMGSGIAAACASAGCETVLLDVSAELAQRGKENMLAGRMPMLDDASAADLISTGGFDDSLEMASNSDWVCEAVVEDLEVKRAIFSRLEQVRKPGSIISTNTSGIPLRSIYNGMPEQFRSDIAVTHFFNPVKVMRLLEVVPGEDTHPEVIESLATFAREKLGKGVVYAKDTVNFIGNRIGCFWMLAGLHKGGEAQKQGVSVEKIDALMSASMGIPSTGLYGLIDLIGLDVMGLVAANLDTNLPSDDAGRTYLNLPSVEQSMLDSGQLGRKTGGGFYRMLKNEDGSRRKQMFAPDSQSWVDAVGASVDQDLRNLAFDDSDEGRFVWALVSETLCYAADLVPDISDDIVNVDRAMRWGFNWAKGPFELIDELGSEAMIEKLQSEGRPIPKMLGVLQSAGADRFYTDSGAGYIGTDGAIHQTPEE